MGQPTGRTAWRWRGVRTSAGNIFSSSVELGRRVAFGADRRAFPGWGFFRTKRSDPLGFFSRHAERSCGGVVTEAWEPRKWLERVSAETIRRDGATRKRIHRSVRRGFFPRGRIRRRGFGTIQSQRAVNTCPTRRARRAAARVFRADARARPFDASAPAASSPRRGFSFPGKRTSPGVFFSLMGFPGWTPWGFSRLTNLVRRTNGGHNAMRMNSRMNHGMNTAPAGGPGIGVTN